MKQGKKTNTKEYSEKIRSSRSHDRKKNEERLRDGLSFPMVPHI